MNTLRITVGIDQKAALLKGLVLGSKAEVEVSPIAMGAYWSRLVERLNMSDTPPSLRTTGNCTQFLPEPTVEAIIAVFAAEDEELAVTARKQAAKLAANEAALAILVANPPAPVAVERAVHANAALTTFGLYSSNGPFAGWTNGAKIGSYTGYVAPASNLPHDGYYDPLPAGKEEFCRQLAATAKAADAEAFEAARPMLAEALAAAKVAHDAAAAAKVAAQATKYAERLASGYWERETASYNASREGAPWCAKVTFPSGAKPNYDFGDSTGKWGKAGLMRIACVPGEIIAWGQKDLRRPDRSDHKIAQMRAGGSMEEIDKTEAFRRWTAAQKVSA